MFKQLHYFKSWLLLMLCTFVGASSAWAQSDYSATYTSNVTLSTAGGTKAEACNVVINETQYDGIKIGTGSAVGAMQIAIPEGTKYLHMHISGWNGVTGLSLNVTGMDPAPASLSVTADAGVNKTSPFTLQEDPSTNDFYKVITFSSPLENETTLTFTTSGKKRCVIYGVNAEDDSAPSDTRTETSVTIDDSGITNTDVYTSTTAGSLSATVMAGAATVTGSSVTWSSDNDAVATVDASTGAVTLVGAGTVNITAAYAGDETNYKPSSATYELTVTNSDPNQPGTVNNPYTVAQALAAQPANGVYVQGTISSITEVSTQYHNATYTISDGTNEMTIYRGKYLNNTDFTSADQIQIGDVVKVYGNLTKYDNVNQMAQNNYIVSQTQKELSSITLSGTYTTTFVEGSEFNHEGVVVTATYSDQTTADVTSQAEFSTPDMTQVGEQTVTVSYGGQSTSYNITITEAPTHTATFSVNGTISTEDFKEGAAITFPSVTAPTGYTFMGWTETAISTTQETAPADLTSSATMGNDDVKYYAVFAVGTGSAPSLTKMVAGDNLEDGDKVVIVANDGEDNYALYQETVSNSYVKYYMFDGTYASVIADDKNWVTVVAGSDGTWKFGDDTNGYLYNSGSNNLSVSTVSSTEWTLEDNNDGTFKLYANKRYLSCRSDLTDNKYLYRMSGTSPSGIYSLDIYKVAAGGGYSDYCTTIPTTVAITITAAGAASFSTTFPLDFTGVEGITAYAATFKTDKYVHLEAVTTVPEGEGIIVKGAEGTYDVPIASGTVTLGVENLLKGTATEGRTVTAAEAETGNFYKYVKASGKVGFQKVTDEWTCQQGHAYLELTTEQAREFKGFADEEGGIATGINAIDNGQWTIDNDAPAYNLAGQKVGKGYKGIVVKNGKKYVK